MYGIKVTVSGEHFETVEECLTKVLNIEYCVVKAYKKQIFMFSFKCSKENLVGITQNLQNIGIGETFGVYEVTELHVVKPFSFQKIQN